MATSAETGGGGGALEHRACATTVGRGGGGRPEDYLTHVFAKGLTVSCAKDFKLDVGIGAILPKLHHPCEARDMTLQRKEKITEGKADMDRGEDESPRQERKQKWSPRVNNQGLGE